MAIGNLSAREERALLKLSGGRPSPAASILDGMRETIKESTVTDAYADFKVKYWNDPSGFVRDCIDWKSGEDISEYQAEIVGYLPQKKRVSIRGPHGLGKTSISAWTILWFALTRDGKDWKLPTTASAWRQLTKFLWPEVHKWAGRLRWDKIGRGPFVDGKELLTLSLKLSTGEAFALASNQPALIEGAHADHILYIFDESKTIPPETWDAAEGAMSTGEAWWLCVSTPGSPAGRFYDIQTRKPGFTDWFVRRVTIEEAIAAGRIDAAWVESRREQWGETSAVFQNRVLGNFAESSEDSIIPLVWVEKAIERWNEWYDSDVEYPFTGIGVDVGRYGSDPSVMAFRYGPVISELQKWRKKDTMFTAGNVMNVVRSLGGQAVIDVIGIGSGVVDRVREVIDEEGLSVEVDAFNGSSKTTVKDRSGELGFMNRRALSWWSMRERLHPDTGDDIALPPDDLLIGDLTAPTWRVTSKGDIRVEEKEEIKKRIGRSPDSGDAVVMIFCPKEPVVQKVKKRAGTW